MPSPFMSQIFWDLLTSFMSQVFCGGNGVDDTFLVPGFGWWSLMLPFMSQFQCFADTSHVPRIFGVC